MPPIPALSFFFWALLPALQPLVLLSTGWGNKGTRLPATGAPSVEVHDVPASPNPGLEVSPFGKSSPGLASASLSLSLKKDGVKVQQLFSIASQRVKSVIHRDLIVITTR